MRGGLASAPGNSNRMRGDGLTLHQGRVRVGIKKNVSGTVVRCQHSCTGSGVSPLLGGVQNCGDVALRDLGMGWGWGSRRPLPT